MNEQVKAARTQFITFMVVGFLLIVLGSFPDSLWWGGIFSILLPNILIVFYARSNYRKDPAFAQGQTFADSTYYMGFLLTIIALVVALVKFGIQNQGESNFASLFKSSMIQFGTALITTIVGMVCRITLVGFKSGTEESLADRLATEEQLLEEATRHLRGRVIEFDHILESTNNEFNQNINRRATQALDEVNAVVQTITAGTEQTVELLSEAARDGAQALTVALDKSLQESSEAFLRLQKSIQGAGTELSTALQQSATAVQQAGNAFKAVASQARQKIEATPEIMEEAANLSLQAAKQFQEASDLFETRISEATSSIDKAAATYRHTLEEFKGNTQDISVRQARANEAISESAQTSPRRAANNGECAKGRLSRRMWHWASNIFNRTRKRGK